MFAEFAAAGEALAGRIIRNRFGPGSSGWIRRTLRRFTQLLNAAAPKPELAGVRVVAAYPGGSPDLPASRDRVAGYTQELRDKFGVAIVELDR